MPTRSSCFLQEIHDTAMSDNSPAYDRNSSQAVFTPPAIAASANSIADLLALVHAQEDFIFSYASERVIDPLTLRAQLLLHLPRLIKDGYFPDKRDLQREIIVVSDFVEESQHPYRHWLAPPEQPISLSDLEFISLEEDIARIFHENFHSVGSYRPGRHYAFIDKKSRRIVCMGSVASFDLKQAEEKIAQVVDPRSILTYSRFFTFRWAPKNTFSYFQRKLNVQLVKECDTKMMFSFINPNLGFSASSHKAAQWALFAREEGTHYMYLDGRYRTMRFFVENYQMNDTRELKEKLGESFAVSTVVLAPLLLLALPLHHRARKAIPMEPYLFQRPVLRDHRCLPDEPRGGIVNAKMVS